MHQVVQEAKRLIAVLSAAYLDSITSPSTGEGDLQERPAAQRFPLFADAEEITGSNPVAPTNSPLTSANGSAWS
jgi:hypothetical protein